jgi:HSP20 family protein
MGNLRIFEPVLNPSLESMFKRFLAPMSLEVESSSIDMRVDVTEIDGMYQVRADLPGVKKEDINVRIDGNIVQIDAEAKQQKDVKESGGRVLCSERWHGAVSRTFTVAQDVDDAKASAKFEDGVLTLDLPKKATTVSKRLAIQ